MQSRFLKTILQQAVEEAELSEDTAVLAADTDYGTLVYDITFSNADITAAGSTVDNYGTVNIPEGSGFPAASVSKLTTGFTNPSITNGVIVGTATGGSKYPTMVSIILDDGYTFPEGIYNFFLDVKQTSNNVTNYSGRFRARGEESDLGIGSQISFAYDETVTFNSGSVTYHNGMFSNKTAYANFREISLYMNSKGKDTFEFDNFKVYWKPIPTVNIDVNGNKNFSDVAAYTVYPGTTITLDELVETYGYADTDDMYFLGMSTSANGYLVDSVKVTEDTTIYLKWKAKDEVVTKHDKYGKLLTLVDFSAVPKSIVKNDSAIGDYLYDGDGTTVNQYSTYLDKNCSTLGWNFQGDTVLTLSDGTTKREAMIFGVENGNEYAKVRLGKERMQWQFTNSAGLYSTHGVYTVLYDMKTDMPQTLIKKVTPSHSWYVFPESVQTSRTLGWSNPTSNTWVRDIELVADYEAKNGVQKIMFGIESLSYNDQTESTNYNIYYDNVRLYWKPFTANITLNVNGNADKENVVYKADTSAVVDLDALKTALGNSEDKLLVGFSRTPDGELITEDFWASEDTTLYAQWKDLAFKDAELGELLFVVDFDNFTTGDALVTVENSDGTTSVAITDDSYLDDFGYVNPLITDFDASKIRLDVQHSISVYNSKQGFNVKTEENGNSYGIITSTGSAGSKSYPFPKLFTTGNVNFYKNGIYTIVAREKVVDMGTRTLSHENLLYYYMTSSSTSSVQGSANKEHSTVPEGWNTYKYVVNKDSSNIDGFTHMTGFGSGWVCSGAGTAVFAWDDIKYYWKPYTSKITIDVNNNDETVSKSLTYTSDNSKKLDISAAEAYLGDTANYTFKGLSFTADGAVITEDFWNSEDITLYAIWEEKEAVTPETVNSCTVRLDSVRGIRFKSAVTTSQKEEADSIGFIVSLETLLGETELTHDCGINFVEGANYDKELDVDKIFAMDDETIFYTAVVHGIPDTADGYSSKFVTRPYVKRGDKYFYGNAVSCSLLDVAIAVRDNDYAGVTDEQKTILENVLTTCGESVKKKLSSIVSYSTVGIDADGLYRNYYDVFCPESGTKLTDVPGTKSAASVSELPAALTDGTITYVSGGYVSEDEDSFEVITSLDFVWLVDNNDENDASTGTYSFSTVAYDSEETCSDCVFAAATGESVVVTEETPVMLLTYSNESQIFKWGIMSNADFDDLCSAKKNLRCYNDKVEDEDGSNYVTRYSPFCKAYVSEDENGNIKYVLLIVNEDDNLALSEKCSEHAAV